MNFTHNEKGGPSGPPLLPGALHLSQLATTRTTEQTSATRKLRGAASSRTAQLLVQK